MRRVDEEPGARRSLSFLTLPGKDAFFGLERCLAAGGGRAFLWVMVGLVAGYWLYVPVHELAHALACWATGGEVTRLEVSPLYGGGLLARVFPWVVSGGEYAGRLSGFDTHGSDAVYLATDLGPFLFTLLPGVWLLRRGGRLGWPALFGFALPWALAPFLSLTGDAYEIGSIVTTWLPPFDEQAALLRGDDLLKVGPAVLAQGGTAPVAGLGLASLLGAFWAFATYGLGGWLASRLGEPRLASSSR
ncbi:MAG TPA: M50 family metallopeptidase [Thermoanaerobaculia bacterium]|nr:M50 family metallopeptidase [Thermoanaerobaculia bacterium]